MTVYFRNCDSSKTTSLRSDEKSRREQSVMLKEGGGRIGDVSPNFRRFTGLLQFYDSPAIFLEKIGKEVFVAGLTIEIGRMSMFTLLLAASLTSLPADRELVQAGDVERVDVALEEMLAGQEGEAVRKILASDLYEQGDPGALINLGTAYARLGMNDEAREAFDAAAHADDPYTLQLADGRWIDSRRAATLAARKLPANGTFATR